MSEKQIKGISFTKRGIVVSNTLLVAGAVWLHGQIDSLKEARCRCGQVAAPAVKSLPEPVSDVARIETE